MAATSRSPTQTNQSTRAYPLRWIEGTFNSKEKTETLFRPEVENGNITYHDMELAQSFFSNKTRYLPFLYSNLAFLSTVTYSRWFARPKWSLTKLVTIGTFLGLGSYTFGFNRKLAAHFRFARSLENPAGFNRALRNINARLGGPEHFPYGVPERRGELIGVALGPGVTALSKNPNVNKLPLETTEPGEDWAVSSSQEQPDQNQIPFPPAPTNAMNTKQSYTLIPFNFTSPECIWSYLKYLFLAHQASQPSVQRPPSKWDEIRAANNKAGSASSWDLIRQSHERTKMSLPPSSQSPTRPRNSTGDAATADGTHDHDDSPDLDSSIAIDRNQKQWDTRAFDEAQFEAVLEAERRRASQA
ncbi:hypothetical protein BDM02DRAFT_3268241 [Thelephora ganbajun]|uniref:Uncharacterized protein n=1 Tax=Thelephora ganbajun TaxID=370292 RepID=A0ACB6ZKE4_THEGA|nr:hypothetical protein BDM02DRAFT_3268241 [Thelephora ganbajun]